jgi:hypothetical protein
LLFGFLTIEEKQGDYWRASPIRDLVHLVLRCRERKSGSIDEAGGGKKEGKEGNAEDRRRSSKVLNA